MSVICKVVVDSEFPRELAFAFEPRVGDVVDVPGIKGKPPLPVVRVAHFATEPDDTHPPDVIVYLATPE
jgi:hypothetical protein